MTRHSLTMRPALLGLALCAAGAGAAELPDTRAGAVSRLSTLSLEELGDIEVSSVSKRPERLADAPAAIYVITREDMRHAGVTTVPEALRLAPNLQVARTSASSYAISARGFNGSSANKLLVLIDGRTVYSPLNSGVFWDVQDVLLEDIDRIEVVSGPGGTLWGANAVNGVINILTRSAKDAASTTASMRAGSHEHGGSVRHGWRIGEDTAVRLYAKALHQDATERADGSALPDAWHRQQAGFRADWGAGTDSATVQGDIYSAHSGLSGGGDVKLSGGNLLLRWNREFGGGSGLQLQAYCDRTRRRQIATLLGFKEDLDTCDADFQHRIALPDEHDVVWGGGWREQRDETSGNALFGFRPPKRALRYVNLFVQDTRPLTPELKLTAGAKLERNTYTAIEFQPSLRLAWKPGEQHLVWAAVSRAVRTPSRVDRDFDVFVNLNFGNPGSPYNARLLGGSHFVSERLTAYEIGYRGQPSAQLSYSVNAFYNRYDRLRSIEREGANFVIGNAVEGHSRGIEAWGTYRFDETWRVTAGFTRLFQSWQFAPGSTDPGQPGTGGNDPKYQAMLRATLELPHDVSIDAGLRGVGALPDPAVPAYLSLDARVAWMVNRNLELSVSGFNLLDRRHPEFGPPASRSEIPRSALVRLVWRY